MLYLFYLLNCLTWLTLAITFKNKYWGYPGNIPSSQTLQCYSDISRYNVLSHSAQYTAVDKAQSCSEYFVKELSLTVSSMFILTQVKRCKYHDHHNCHLILLYHVGVPLFKFLAFCPCLHSSTQLCAIHIQCMYVYHIKRTLIKMAYEFRFFMLIALVNFVNEISN